jgi:hypothetical protein
LLSKEGIFFKKGRKQKWKGSYLLIILFKIKHKQWSNLLLISNIKITHTELAENCFAFSSTENIFVWPFTSYMLWN